MGEIDKPLIEISKKLDNVQKLLAMIAAKGLETEQDKIELLDRLGFKPVEIANFLSKSPDNISVQLNRIRKKKDKAPNEKTALTNVTIDKQQQLDSINNLLTEKS